MSKHVPDFIDPFRAAEGRHGIAGRIPFTRMARLSTAVENRDGAAEVVLNFAVDEQGIPFVNGRVQSDVVLTCQRCLEPMNLPIDITVELGIVASDEEAKRLPAHYDPLVAGEGKLAVAELIEDEILLALPAIPRHDGACVAKGQEPPAEQDKDPAANPFAVLAQLKSKR